MKFQMLRIQDLQDTVHLEAQKALHNTSTFM